MAACEDPDAWLSYITLDRVLAMLQDNGTVEVLYKILPCNANSKNQVYLASDLSQLGKLPSGEVTLHRSTSVKSGTQEAVFRSKLELFWLDRDGRPHAAPNAQLILYPQYPEVRLSGFLQGCARPPSSLWNTGKRGSEADRILVLGVGRDRRIVAITLPPESPAAREIRATEPHEAYGALGVLPLLGQQSADGFLALMGELCRIHRLGWVPSTRLDRDGRIVPCNASNCNGNTLESLLGIRSNGFSLPDYRGWEIKVRQVSDVDNPSRSIVTLFTPEPSGGRYIADGVVTFIRCYGYVDTLGRPDRLNVGGVYRVNHPANQRTGLRLVMQGFDATTDHYIPSGSICLMDARDNIAAAWSFAKLMDHWKTKHAQAAFVPAQASTSGDRRYRYGRKIQLGEGAEFRLFLRAVHEGRVYYDLGIKLEAASTDRPRPKKRSQFRVSSGDLESLYTSSRIVDACTCIEG